MRRSLLKAIGFYMRFVAKNAIRGGRTSMPWQTWKRLVEIYERREFEEMGMMG
jgi:hypothetical protein